MIFSSVPVYFAFIAWKNKPMFFQNFIGKLKLANFRIHEKKQISRQ